MYRACVSQLNLLCAYVRLRVFRSKNEKQKQRKYEEQALLAKSSTTIIAKNQENIQSIHQLCKAAAAAAAETPPAPAQAASSSKQAAAEAAQSRQVPKYRQRDPIQRSPAAAACEAHRRTGAEHGMALWCPGCVVHLRPHICPSRSWPNRLWHACGMPV